MLPEPVMFEFITGIPVASLNHCEYCLVLPNLPLKKIAAFIFSILRIQFVQSIEIY